MSATEPRIDTYIENSPNFAQPVLSYLREIIHETCPEVEEGWKWSFPHFMYNGKILCSLAAFKQYCSMGFWLHSEMKTIKDLELNVGTSGMFSLGKIAKLEDLPSKPQLKAAIKEAMELTDMGVTIKKTPVSKTETEIPSDFAEALEMNTTAQQFFMKASPSFRKEYILWITGAKTEATRIKRMEQALEWIAEGKGRNWKYEKK
ncbi:MAG: YdeI/OmpD-associated family protein [Kaistella sp.]|nr:YdeI/OmpD-associated family protein [Kaistella sp.]